MWNDQKWQEKTPPLCNADISILRWRIPDVMPYVSDKTVEILSNLDYVSFINCAIYSIVFPEQFEMLADIGVFDARDNIIQFGKRITSSIKRVNCEELHRQPFAEFHSLAGYQQAEPEGWDLRTEVEALANAGDEHGMCGSDFDREFDMALLAISEGRETEGPDYMDFQAYVRSGKWVTSGSSSIGHVQWEMDGKTGHFKARKNMLTCLYTADELIDLVDRWDKKLFSRAFIKPELAKRRVAVASNIESYLNDSYVLYLMGHGYKNWKGVTLDETRNQEQTRVRETMIRMGNGEYALPFDYAAFDHQPTTDEIVKIIKHMTRRIDPRARKYVTNMIVSYSNSYIWYQDKDGNHTLKVRGGLPSGVRPTSLIGNIWNACMCEIAVKRTAILMNANLVQYYKVRGDDSYFISPSVTALIMLRLVMAGINAKGSNAKFGIASGHVEFLRTNMTGVTTRGWACRTIPTLSQRKPWNPEPWSPVSETATLVKGVETICRRCNVDSNILMSIIERRFSKLTGLSKRWLSVPRRLGGFGLTKDVGWRARGKIPIPTRQQFDVKPAVNLELPEWLEGLISPEKYTEAFLSTTIATDDIPGTVGVLRGPYIKQLRNFKTEWDKIEVVPRTVMSSNWLTSRTLVPEQQHIVYNSVDGKITLLEFMSQYGIASLAAKLDSMMEFMKRMFPAAYQRVKGISKRGWHISDAIDIATGDKPIARMPKVSPLLNTYAKEIVWTDGEPMRWSGRKQIGTELYRSTYAAAAALWQSQLNLCYLY
ncbi:hypothetical protein 2 [Wuhan insect virus 31]|uniref:RNA-directed RNA polymerase n=1 Tax=Wuhan insect virus 31 TaxID=1923735 RepID=A0A1L3KF59_9VIRU|nr:hypothetical protein 2 [Wuhan insect virus 31]APG76056.1 hypothetical protein 2 [Wuhan insect virus 31]